MFFSKVELFWYEFRILDFQNMMKKSFGNKTASQTNVATDIVTSQCFYVKVCQIFG